MFNDLNDSNNQTRPAVDDIFAETDKAQDAPRSLSQNSNLTAASAPEKTGSSEIDTQKIGLTATEDMSEDAQGKKGQDKLFKIIIIAIAVIVLALGGYLVYSKFLKIPVATTPTTQSDDQASVPASAPATTVPATSSGSFVEPAGDVIATASVPLIPGVNAPLATSSEAAVPIIAPISMVDSDSDGLTDAEEQAAGTNINIIDTDNDGLSDYEEVKIYKTNPLSADTDGDGYLDGAEVKSGYNPNGAGKLSDIMTADQAVSTVQ